MTDKEKNENPSEPLDLFSHQLTAKESDTVPEIKDDRQIVESSSVLKHFFPPEIFEEETSLNLQNIKQGGNKNRVLLAMSFILLIIIAAAILPGSKLFRAFFAKTGSYNLKIEDTHQGIFGGNKYKGQLKDIENAFNQKQWNAVDAKTRELLFNNELKDPATRKWLFQMRLECLIELGRWINVQGTSLAAVREFPDFNKAHYYVAFASANLNDYQTATSHFQKFQSSLKYPIETSLEEKLTGLEIKIMTGQLKLDASAKLDNASNIYHSNECNRILDMMDKFEKKIKETGQKLPSEYLSIKLNFFNAVKAFLTDSLFTKKSLSINGKTYNAEDARQEIANIQRDLRTSK